MVYIKKKAIFGYLKLVKLFLLITIKKRYIFNFIKTKKPELHLNVYRKNTRAIRFYQREDFEILNEGLDEAIGEKDCAMLWRSK